MTQHIQLKQRKHLVSSFEDVSALGFRRVGKSLKLWCHPLRWLPSNSGPIDSFIVYAAMILIPAIYFVLPSLASKKIQSTKDWASYCKMYAFHPLSSNWPLFTTMFIHWLTLPVRLLNSSHGLVPCRIIWSPAPPTANTDSIDLVILTKDEHSTISTIYFSIQKNSLPKTNIFHPDKNGLEKAHFHFGDRHKRQILSLFLWE